MQMRPFGSHDFQVSALGFGAGHIGADGMTDQEASYLVQTILDRGINLLDTARGYGKSEMRIGQALKGRRDSAILSTKVGYDVAGQEDWTYDAVAGGIDQALRLMQTDYIDIVHLHSCARDILARGDVIEALAQAKQAGKIRAMAYSGDGVDLAYAFSTGAFDSFQTSVNLFDQRVTDSLPHIAAKGKAVIAKRPLGNAPWRFAERPAGHYAEEYWLRFQAMGLELKESSWLETALRFTVFEHGVTSSIIGTANLSHLDANLALLSKGPLPEARVNELKQTFKRHDQDWVSQV